MKSNTESYQSMNMGPRNLLILFFSAVAVSLVILIILSSLVFKNLNLDFNTHMPESTPDIGRQFSNTAPAMNPDSKADNVSRATVNVPPESAEPAPAAGSEKAEIKDKADKSAMDNAPISDDSVLENNSPLPLGDTIESDRPPVASPAKPSTDKSSSAKGAIGSSRTSRSAAEHKTDSAPANNTPDLPAYDDVSGDSGQSNGPPVPGQ
jgi:hypothetical protein